MQKKLEQGNLLDEKGHLIEAGYAKSHVKLYNRGNIKASELKIKEWDYYYINNDHFGIGITVADNGYMGLVSLVLVDFEHLTLKKQSKTLYFPMGKLNLSCTPDDGKVVFNKKNISINFDYAPDKTQLKIYWKNYADRDPFELDVTLSDKPKDSMVLTVPFDEKPTQFYYNHKTIGMKCEGFFVYKGEKQVFNKENTTALLDYGRGVWPYQSQWYWGAAQGMQDGHMIGVNIGHGFGNTKNASEDMFFYDGAAHKIDRGTFKISSDDSGSLDYLKPWTYETEDKRLYLTFTPLVNRKDSVSLLILKSSQNQVFGHYDGVAVLDNGTKIQISKLPGFAEHFFNKW